MKLKKYLTTVISVCLLCSCIKGTVYADDSINTEEEFVIINSIEEGTVIEVDNLDNYIENVFSNAVFLSEDNVEVELLSVNSSNIECSGYVTGSNYVAVYGVWVDGINAARFMITTEWSYSDGNNATLKELYIATSFLNPNFNALNNNDCNVFYSHGDESVVLTHSFRLMSGTYGYNQNIRMWIYLSIYGDFRLNAREE